MNNLQAENLQAENTKHKRPSYDNTTEWGMYTLVSPHYNLLVELKCYFQELKAVSQLCNEHWSFNDYVRNSHCQIK